MHKKTPLSQVSMILVSRVIHWVRAPRTRTGSTKPIVRLEHISTGTRTRRANVMVGSGLRSECGDTWLVGDHSPFFLQSAQALLSGCLTSSRRIRALRSVVDLSEEASANQP
jgi:hypothetical protein